jgi:LPS sulfotransferase NodH
MRSYAICATPRTGSTYLCSLLHEARLGNPDEWLHAGRVRSWTTIKELRAQRRVNGVFAIKLFWVHREDAAIVDFDDVLPASGKWIFLRRKDTLAQARSYLTALSREEWADVGVPYEKFPRELELRTEAKMRRRNDDWNRWFRRKGIKPLRLTYEEIIADPTGTVDSVRALLYDRTRR